MAAHKFHLQQQFVGHGGAAICSGILLGDNKTVVTSGYDRTLQLWKVGPLDMLIPHFKQVCQHFPGC